MSYQKTLDYLYARLPMFSRIGAAAYKPDLSNTLKLCAAFDNPQYKFKSIHIAGTNGKGSTSHMVAAVLQAAGYKTGLYTSPHIKDFGERIRINGEMISEKFVIDFVERAKPAIDEIGPSFFELTVVMAFEYFAQTGIDTAVIETGLGGLLDSTNVITPELSIITNISRDHTNLLGKTTAEIAEQKAGIIKPSVPVVIGEADEELRSVFRAHAKAKNAAIFFAEDNDLAVHLDQVGLKGSYQFKNVRTVLTAVDALKQIGYELGESSVAAGLKNVVSLTGIRGRWEQIGSQPDTFIDVGHNEAGIQAVVTQVQTDYPSGNHHFVLGFVRDKELDNVLLQFPKNARYYFTNAHLPRALPAAELQAVADSYGLTGEMFDDVNEALSAAKQNSSSTDVIVVCGSFFVIAELDI